MEFLVGLAEDALGFLPNSPFANLNLDALGQFSLVMGWINYFVPVGAMLNILSVYLVSVGLWYVVRWILRLTQYID